MTSENSMDVPPEAAIQKAAALCEGKEVRAAVVILEFDNGEMTVCTGGADGALDLLRVVHRAADRLLEAARGASGEDDDDEGEEWKEKEPA
jgi:hypothetical protein